MQHLEHASQPLPVHRLSVAFMRRDWSVLRLVEVARGLGPMERHMSQRSCGAGQQRSAGGDFMEEVGEEALAQR